MPYVDIHVKTKYRIKNLGGTNFFRPPTNDSPLIYNITWFIWSFLGWHKDNIPITIYYYNIIFENDVPRSLALAIRQYIK